jgi:DNA mismatch endonuclease (patch repair protein)
MGTRDASTLQFRRTNSDFWKAKIEANKARDLNDRLQLKNMGWHVIQIWQCQLKPKEREKILKALEYTLNEIMLINFKKETYLSADDNQTTTKNAAEDMGGYE